MTVFSSHGFSSDWTSEHRGTNHDCNKDHRYHYSANPKHPALRAILYLARTSLMPSSRDAHRKSVPDSGARPVLSQGLAKGLLLGIVTFLCCMEGWAQNPDQDDVIRVRTDLVSVTVTVVDSHGHRIGGLNQEDFVMRDDGRDVKVGHFSSGTDRVALVFLLDASGSARDYVFQQREAALALFSRLGPGSQVAVAHFGNGPKVTVPFTSEITKARRGFDFNAAAGQHSAIFDSAAAAVQLLARRQSDPAERRIIVLTSDGLDSASSTKAAEVINCARSNAISFYVIHFPLFAPQDGHLAMRATSRGFRDLAEKTGGRFFTAGDVKLALNPGARYDLSPVFRSIEEDLASQYVIGFYPAAAEGSGPYHKVEVSLAKSNKRNLRVELLRRLPARACLPTARSIGCRACPVTAQVPNALSWRYG